LPENYLQIVRKAHKISSKKISIASKNIQQKFTYIDRHRLTERQTDRRIYRQTEDIPYPHKIKSITAKKL
jgi:GMP synthase PP-ATPase subunit